MRVSINSHYLHRKMSGLARYARQVQALLMTDGHQIVQIQLPSWFYREGGKFRRVLRFIALASYELVAPPLTLLLGRAECHISPAFAAPLGLFSNKYLVVVHDLAFVEYPDMYTWMERLYMRMNLELLRWGRHRIVVPSEFVKEQICQHYRISPIRVHKISPYSEFSPLEPLAHKNKKYFILLSNAHPRKNLQATVAGFLASGACLAGYQLVVVGNFENVVHTDSRNVLICKGLSDRQLETLISGASALVLFSLSEGFGFPVVEAASLGVVSLTSGISSLAELCVPGDRARKVTKQDDIRAAFDRFLTDDGFRNKLEADRQYVNATFSRHAFDQNWRELINDK